MSTKQDIIDYVMETPENTNPAILGQMLDELYGGETVTMKLYITSDNAANTYIQDVVAKPGELVSFNLNDLIPENTTISTVATTNKSLDHISLVPYNLYGTEAKRLLFVMIQPKDYGDYSSWTCDRYLVGYTNAE